MRRHRPPELSLSAALRRCLAVSHVDRGRAGAIQRQLETQGLVAELESKSTYSESTIANLFKKTHAYDKSESTTTNLFKKHMHVTRGYNAIKRRHYH
jgi:hypothetical protein